MFFNLRLEQPSTIACVYYPPGPQTFIHVLNSALHKVQHSPRTTSDQAKKTWKEVRFSNNVDREKERPLWTETIKWLVHLIKATLWSLLPLLNSDWHWQNSDQKIEIQTRVRPILTTFTTNRDSPTLNEISSIAIEVDQGASSRL